MLIFASFITFAFTTLLTLAGVGTAFILIPVFLAFGVELHTAMATALLLNAIAMSIASVTFIRKQLMVWQLVLPMSVLAIMTAPIGVQVAHGLERALLLWLFVAFLLFAAGMMLFYHPRQRAKSFSTAQALALGLPVGGAAGFIGGLLGVGGGNIIVPALVSAGLEPKRAAASTSFVVIFASLTGFVAHVQVGKIDPALLAVTATATAAGALLGAWLATEKLRAGQLKRIMALVLIAVAFKTIWDLLR